MAGSSESTSSSSTNAYLLVPILLLFALLIVAVLRSPNLVTSAGIGSAIIILTPLALATYALMAVAIAGRGTVDLSVGPLLGFINVTLVKLFEADVFSSPLAFFAYAIAVGVAYHLIMGLIIVFVRVQPMIVALSGYLALTGINLVILPRPGGSAPEWMMPWGLGTSILSPVLAILVLSTAAWLIFTRSAFYGHLRLMGSDERAAYTSGVRISIVRIGAHMISGIFCALAALTFTALIGSGDPTQGTTYTLIAVTALVLGGTSLAGGRGGVIGSLLGAVNIFLIGYVLSTFRFGAVQGFVTDLAYGVILVLSLLLTLALPWIQARIRNISPVLVFTISSMLFIGVTLHATYDYSRGTPKSLDANATAVSAAPPVRVGGNAQAADQIIAMADASTTAAPPAQAATASIEQAGGAAKTETVAVATNNPAPQPAANPGAAGSVSNDNHAAVAAPSVDRMATEPSAPAIIAGVTVAEETQLNDRLGRDFILENSDALKAYERSTLSVQVTFASIVLLSLLALLRTLVAQSGTRRITPSVTLILILLIALAAYWLATNMDVFPNRQPPSSEPVPAKAFK